MTLATDWRQCYETPESAVLGLIEHCPPVGHGRVIREPAAGRGMIARVLGRNGYRVHANEPRECCHDELGNQPGVDLVQSFDWLLHPEYDLPIITNPPDELALEFAQACKWAPYVALFMRLTFLESQKRRHFINRHPIKQILPMAKREQPHNPWIPPEVAAKRGRSPDSVGRAWFIWELGAAPRAPRVIG